MSCAWRSFLVVLSCVGALAPARADAPPLEPARPAKPTEPVQLKRFEVTANSAAQLNAIDRKVYNVGQEALGATGSASDLLQNIPSVEVDLNGNVSLRGSDDVQILIDGRTSTLMGRNRADVLAQLSADSIDHIEVITNPSAKNKPDGTAGIINIALEHKHDAGMSGAFSFNAGNARRYNSSLTLNYRPGRFNFTGGFGVRQDDRVRTASDVRTITDPVTAAVWHADKRTVETSRPFTQFGRLGVDFVPDDANQFSVMGTYNHRSFTRQALDHNVVTASDPALSREFYRARFDPEADRTEEADVNYRHNFPEAGHELNLEFKTSVSKDGEPNHYTNTYVLPPQTPTFDNVIVADTQRSHEAIAGYVRPLANDAKFEAGFDLTHESRDSDFHAENLDPVTGGWVTDLTKSNRFVLERSIEAFYATYGRTFGPWAVLAGLRPEISDTTSRLVTTGERVEDDFAQVYPSLHLTRTLDDRQELQANYSRRINRPQPEDLNPFNLRSGNPHLRPEDIHSVEAGYSYREGDTGFTATAYTRDTRRAFTWITSDLGAGVLLTRRDNLGHSRASGLELTLNAELGRKVSLNASTNTFYNTIDAANLGYSSSRSDVSWLGKLGATWKFAADTQVQMNANYTSARLTPQGERRPSWVANAGLRHELFRKQVALVVTVSDLFDSLRESYVVDTPLLHEEVTRRRSARIVFVGFTYNFGVAGKKSKDDGLKFDNSL